MLAIDYRRGSYENSSVDSGVALVSRPCGATRLNGHVVRIGFVIARELNTRHWAAAWEEILHVPRDDFFVQWGQSTWKARQRKATQFQPPILWNSVEVTASITSS